MPGWSGKGHSIIVGVPWNCSTFMPVFPSKSAASLSARPAGRGIYTIILPESAGSEAGVVVCDVEGAGVAAVLVQAIIPRHKFIIKTIIRAVFLIYR